MGIIYPQGNPNLSQKLIEIHGSVIPGLVVVRPISWKPGRPVPRPQAQPVVIPRVIRLVRLFHIPADRGVGDTVARWMRNRFKDKERYGPKNKIFLKRIAVCTTCQSKQSVLNQRYPYGD